MTWWWSLFSRHSGVVFATALLVLVLFLFWASLPTLYGDSAQYPAMVASRYVGGGIYFPIVVAYLVMALPYLVYEQRRQLDRLMRRAHAPRFVGRAYDRVLTRFPARRSILYVGAGIILTILYMFSQKILFVEGLTPAQEVRRAAYWVMPVVMWYFFLESFGVIFRVSALARRFIDRHMDELVISRDAFRPFVRLFTNSAMFMAFATMGLPLMWIGSALPLMDVALFTTCMLWLAYVMSRPILRLLQRVQRGELTLSPRFARSGTSWVDERNDFFDDAVLTRLFATMLRAAKPEEALAPHRAVIVLLMRFWAIMVAPLLIWALAILVEVMMADAGIRNMF